MIQVIALITYYLGFILVNILGFIIFNTAFIIIRFAKFKNEKIKNILSSILIVLILNFIILFYLGTLPCSGDACKVFRFMFQMIISLIAMPIAMIGTYFLIKKIEKVKSIIFNLFLIIAILGLVWSLLITVGSFNYGDSLEHSNKKIQKAIENNNPDNCEISFFEILYFRLRLKPVEGLGIIKDKCYGKFAVESGNLINCEQIKEDWKKDSCYRDMAVEKEDITLCDKIVPSAIREGCYVSVALKKRDVSMCNTVDSSFKRNHCFESMAINTLNESLCLYIPEESTDRSECISRLAGMRQNENICLLITNKYKNSCLFSLAADKKDENVCEIVDNKEEKQKCKEMVQKIKSI